MARKVSMHVCIYVYMCVYMYRRMYVYMYVFHNRSRHSQMCDMTHPLQVVVWGQVRFGLGDGS